MNGYRPLEESIHDRAESPLPPIFTTPIVKYEAALIPVLASGLDFLPSCRQRKHFSSYFMPHLVGYCGKHSKTLMDSEGQNWCKLREKSASHQWLFISEPVPRDYTYSLMPLDSLSRKLAEQSLFTRPLVAD